MVFLRVGVSDGTAPLMNESVTAGIIYYLASRSDLIGFGANWGSPSDDSLREQGTAEFFYRLQLAQNVAITPAVQLIVDPALNADEDTLWIGSLRARLTL